MPKKRAEPEVEELKDNEEFISRDDIDIEVRISEDNTVMVLFSGFDDEEDSEEYAHFLAETLPLLLFETTRLQ
ncbi:hypothetical protein EBU71_13090 [bacterium]|nr:hypothetical protein [Candidatus Elulimicrobium humile]